MKHLLYFLLLCSGSLLYASQPENPEPPKEITYNYYSNPNKTWAETLGDWWYGVPAYRARRCPKTTALPKLTFKNKDEEIAYYKQQLTKCNESKKLYKDTLLKMEAAWGQQSSALSSKYKAATTQLEKNRKTAFEVLQGDQELNNEFKRVAAQAVGALEKNAAQAGYYKELSKAPTPEPLFAIPYEEKIILKNENKVPVGNITIKLSAVPYYKYVVTAVKS